jgi:hypothetical protein
MLRGPVPHVYLSPIVPLRDSSLRGKVLSRHRNPLEMLSQTLVFLGRGYGILPTPPGSQPRAGSLAECPVFRIKIIPTYHTCSKRFVAQERSKLRDVFLEDRE